MDEEWFSTLPGKMAEAVSSAQSSLTEVKIGTAKGHEESISHNARSSKVAPEAGELVVESVLSMLEVMK